jgi:hypothetical protein
MFGPQAPCIPGCHRVIHRVASFEVACDGQAVQRLDELVGGFSAELPDALRAPPPVALNQRGQILVRFLHQERRAGRRTPAPDMLCLDERHAHSGLGEAPRHGGAGDAAADDRHIDGEILSEDGKARASSGCFPFQPERDVDSETRHIVGPSWRRDCFRSTSHEAAH